jgi:hypothetical protein
VQTENNPFPLKEVEGENWPTLKCEEKKERESLFQQPIDTSLTLPIVLPNENPKSLKQIISLPTKEFHQHEISLTLKEKENLKGNAEVVREGCMVGCWCKVL